MAYMDHTLGDLPREVRELALSAVRTLAKRGPRGLVESNLCPPDWEQPMMEARNDYPGDLVELPESAELYFYVRDGVWEIDLPLHNQSGRIDLFMFLEIDPRDMSVKLRGLYTP